MTLVTCISLHKAPLCSVHNVNKTRTKIEKYQNTHNNNNNDNKSMCNCTTVYFLPYANDKPLLKASTVDTISRIAKKKCTFILPANREQHDFRFRCTMLLTPYRVDYSFFTLPFYCWLLIVGYFETITPNEIRSSHDMSRCFA